MTWLDTEPTRLLVTGSRNFTDVSTLQEALDWAVRVLGEDIVLVRGGCPTGLDALADAEARVRGWQVEVFPADWETYGRAAGPSRNHTMVFEGVELCLGFPLGESRGVRSCMSLAHSKGIPVVSWTEESCVH